MGNDNDRFDADALMQEILAAAQVGDLGRAIEKAALGVRMTSGSSSRLVDTAANRLETAEAMLAMVRELRARGGREHMATVVQIAAGKILAGSPLPDES